MPAGRSSGVLGLLQPTGHGDQIHEVWPEFLPIQFYARTSLIARSLPAFRDGTAGGGSAAPPWCHRGWVANLTGGTDGLRLTPDDMRTQSQNASVWGLRIPPVVRHEHCCQINRYFSGKENAGDVGREIVRNLGDCRAGGLAGVTARGESARHAFWIMPSFAALLDAIVDESLRQPAAGKLSILQPADLHAVQ